MSLTIENHFYSRICEFNANYAMHYRKIGMTRLEKTKQLLASPFFFGSLCLFLIVSLPILKEVPLIYYYLSIVLMCSLSLGFSFIAEQHFKQSIADEVAVRMGYKNKSSYLNHFDRNLLHSFCQQNKLYHVYDPVYVSKMQFITLHHILSDNLISFNPTMPTLTVNS